MRGKQGVNGKEENHPHENEPRATAHRLDQQRPKHDGDDHIVPWGHVAVAFGEDVQPVPGEVKRKDRIEKETGEVQHEMNFTAPAGPGQEDQGDQQPDHHKKVGGLDEDMAKKKLEIEDLIYRQRHGDDVKDHGNPAAKSLKVSFFFRHTSSFSPHCRSRGRQAR